MNYKINLIDYDLKSLNKLKEYRKEYLDLMENYIDYIYNKIIWLILTIYLYLVHILIYFIYISMHFEFILINKISNRIAYSLIIRVYLIKLIFLYRKYI